MVSLTRNNSSSREQLYNFMNFQRKSLNKIAYKPYLYHIKRRILPVRRLASQLARCGKVFRFERILLRSFVLTLRASFIPNYQLKSHLFSYDFLFHSSFLLLRELSGESSMPDYVLFWRLLEVDPMFKAVLIKRKKKKPKSTLYFMPAEQRIYVTFRWAASYLRMRNASLKKSNGLARGFQHLLFSEKHCYPLTSLKLETYRLFMIQEQNS